MSSTKVFANKPLKRQILDLIRFKGPLTVNEYMKIVLTNPESGFYMNDDVFGVKGHFTTNPEISQVFGEILGAWIVQEWRRFGCPRPLRLVEFGPGRGTLMSDVTRTINLLDKVPNSIQIRLIEVSPKLRDIQRQTLAEYAADLCWFSHLEGIDDRDTFCGFTAFIAHEYLDALPIHKFVRDKVSNQWRELLIDYDKNENLRFCIGRQPTLAARLLIPEKFDGDQIEVCPEAALQLERVSNCLNATQKGCMLICDYGFEEKQGRDKVDRDTFRAFKNHEPWWPLKDPGHADLTADLDFGYLKDQIRDKAIVYGSVSQRDFLVQCGIQERVKTLTSSSKFSPEQKSDLLSGVELMIGDMGQRYRFMSLFPKDSGHLFEGDSPAGFWV